METLFHDFAGVLGFGFTLFMAIVVVTNLYLRKSQSPPNECPRYAVPDKVPPAPENVKTAP